MSESTDGQFRVEFGDGVLGRKPVTGNIVLLEALISEGNEVNGANTFSASGTVGGYSTVSVTTSNASSGGSNKETIESIKFNAPKTYETQNRAVTTDDYKKIVEGNVSGLDSVSVWGGQDNPHQHMERFLFQQNQLVQHLFLLHRLQKSNQQYQVIIWFR